MKQHGAQSNADCRDVALAAELAHVSAARSQRPEDARGDLDELRHPVQGGVGEENVEFAPGD